MATPPGIVIYLEHEQLIQCLDAQGKAELLDALLEYAKTGIIPDIKTDTVKIVFLAMSAKINKDKEKYQKTCDRNKNNAGTRWQYKDTNDDKNVPDDTSGTETVPSDTKSTSGTETVPDDTSGIEIVPDDTKNANININKKENININKNNKKENYIKEKNLPPSPKEEKKAYGEFGSVKLTENEYDKLVQRLGKDGTANYITRLDGWLAEGHTKKNCYATILNWARKDTDEGKFNLAPIKSKSLSFDLAEIDRLTNVNPGGGNNGRTRDPCAAESYGPSKYGDNL